MLVAGNAGAQTKGLKLGAVTGSRATLPISLASDSPVEGFVVGASFDASALKALDVREAGVAAGKAELVVPEIFPDGFTIGVILDFDQPYDGQTIPAGSNLLVAEADIEAKAVLPCGQQTIVPVILQDGLNDPPLDNCVVTGGRSITRNEGLVMTNGSVTVPGACGTFRVRSTTGEPGERRVAVPIELDFQDTTEGYIIATQHQAGVALETISTAGTEAGDVGIEFEVTHIYPDGGTLGVVFDFDPPFNGQELPAGQNQRIAIFTYALDPFECTGVPAADSRTFAIRFRDNVFGDPPLSNVVVSRGTSVPAAGIDGTVTFQCNPAGGIDFYVGSDTGGEDPQIVCAKGPAGGEASVRLYYTSDAQPIQGLSMAICFPPQVRVLDLDQTGQGIVGDRHLEGSVTQAINAEFVSFNADNEAGEFIAGILVDSTPPIPINHMYPPSSVPARILTVYFAIPTSARCDTVYPLRFCDGITGAGDVPIDNRAAVFNVSVPARTHDGCIGVAGRAVFIRGDCNSDQMVDIADPAATMSYLFLNVFDPSCLDACDSNDDGMVDLVDVTFTLRYLFKFGRVIPPPGPFPPGGTDPTPDVYGLDLGCESGDPCD